MNKMQNPTILLNNLYLFTDPSAKGEEKNNFHLFVLGKNNFGFFLHNGAKYFLDNLQNASEKIFFYTPTNETNLEGKNVISKNFHNAHYSHKIIDLLATDNFSLKGIQMDTLEILRPIMREQEITLKGCCKYEHALNCAQKRKNDKTTQKSLMEFCQ